MQIWLHFGGNETGKFYLLHVIVDLSVLNKGSVQERVVNTGISNYKLHVSPINTTALFFAFNLSEALQNNTKKIRNPPL